MIDPDLKKYLDDLIRLQKAELELLSEIKFELQNSRKLREAREKEEIGGKYYSLWELFKYWLKKR